MKINRAFIKGTNWALAGLLSLLGFSGCDNFDQKVEYGSPNADYTVKGTVVNKADGKPIEGIRIGYNSTQMITTMYGVPSVPYVPKAPVSTNTKGEFKLKDNFFYDGFQSEENGIIPIYVEDIDGEQNGLFESKVLEIDFKEAEHSGKSKTWYKGEYIVNVKVELTEIKDQ